MPGFRVCQCHGPAQSRPRVPLSPLPVTVTVCVGCLFLRTPGRAPYSHGHTIKVHVLLGVDLFTGGQSQYGWHS